MRVDQREEQGRLVLSISGKCTVENAAALRETLLAAVETGKALALEVSGVEDVDITFLQLLLATAQTMEKRSACLIRVGALSPTLAEAARVSGFDQTPRLQPFLTNEGQPCPGQMA